MKFIFLLGSVLSTQTLGLRMHDAYNSDAAILAELREDATRAIISTLFPNAPTQQLWNSFLQKAQSLESDNRVSALPIRFPVPNPPALPDHLPETKINVNVGLPEQSQSCLHIYKLLKIAEKTLPPVSPAEAAGGAAGAVAGAAAAVPVGAAAGAAGGPLVAALAAGAAGPTGVVLGGALGLLGGVVTDLKTAGDNLVGGFVMDQASSDLPKTSLSDRIVLEGSKVKVFQQLLPGINVDIKRVCYILARLVTVDGKAKLGKQSEILDFVGNAMGWALQQDPDLQLLSAVESVADQANDILK